MAKLMMMMMMWATVALLVACAGAELDLELVWSPEPEIWALQQDFDLLAEQISLRMEEDRELDSVEGAMWALKSLRKNWPVKAAGLMGKIGLNRRQPSQVMEMVAELERVSEDCQDPKSFALLKDIFYLAVGGGQHEGRRVLDESKSKLHLVVRKAWQRHSDLCRSTYADLANSKPIYRPIFEQLRAYFDLATLEQNYGSKDPLTILKLTPAQVSELLPKSGKFWTRRTYEVSQGTPGADHFVVVEAADGDGSEIQLSDKGKQIADWPRQAIESRISNKCAYAYKYFDLLGPVMFDLAADESKLEEILQGDETFAHTLMALKVCPAIIEHQEQLIRAVGDYLRI